MVTRTRRPGATEKVPGTFCAKHPSGPVGKRFLAPFPALVVLCLVGVRPILGGPAPIAPTRLRALGRDSEAVLAWQASAGATAYHVKQATVRSGPYTTVAKDVATTRHTVTKLENDTPYYFVVSGASPAGPGADSTPARATPFRLPPRGDEWMHTYRTRVKGRHAFFHLWIPKNTRVAKALLVFSWHGSGGPLAEHAELRYLAGAMNCAVVGFGGETVKRGFSPSRILLDALTDLAKQSRHPEVAHAPMLVFGHSNGTGFSAGFTSQEPQRVFAWIAFKSACGRQFSKPAIYGVPGLVISGEKDRSYFTDQLTTVERLRHDHHALMHMIVEPNAGHGPNRYKSYTILMAFIRTMFELSVPADADPTRGPVTLVRPLEADGWLGRNWDKAVGGGQQLPIAPYAAFTGDKTRASWLPTEHYTRQWQEFSRTGIVLNWW